MKSKKEVAPKTQVKKVSPKNVSNNTKYPGNTTRAFRG